MPDFCIWKHYKRFWICLNKLFNYGRVLNMPGQSFIGFWICKGYTWCWICLNKPEYALNITSTAKQKLLKMCHLRHRLRIFFFFHRKVMFHSQDIQVFVFLTIPWFNKSVTSWWVLVHETGCIFEYIFWTTTH